MMETASERRERTSAFAQLFDAIGAMLAPVLVLAVAGLAIYIGLTKAEPELVSSQIDPVLRQSGQWISEVAAAIAAQTGALNPQHVYMAVTALGVLLVVRRLLRTRLAHELGDQLGGNLLSNWRLVLLGLTGIALSIASGWTTWDGMTNFTGNPVLSLLITFGIQGVMLIAAWLIGESFAVGLSAGRGHKERGSRTAASLFWILAIGALTAATFYLGKDVLRIIQADDPGGAAQQFLRELNWQRNQGKLTIAVASFVAFLVLLTMLSSGEILGPYFRGAKVMAKNLPIWLMFLACMATSVFFSFDSLFSTIFPAGERGRAADLRTQNQVAGLVADVGARLQLRQSQAVDDLFAGQDWQKYDRQLVLLLNEARRAPGLIEAEYRRRITETNTRSAGFEEQAATASSSIANLEVEKQRKLDRIASLEGDQPALKALVESLNGRIADATNQIIAKEIEIKAEEEGVSARSGSGNAGRGPLFRQKSLELRNLQFERQALEQERDRQRQKLDQIIEQQRAIRRELVEAEAEIARLRGEMQSARQSLEFEKQQRSNDTGPKLDASGGFQSLETQLTVFRRQPTVENFKSLQFYCGVLLNTLQTVDQLKAKVAEVNCEPEAASTAASPIFVLNKAIEDYRSTCGDGTNLPTTGGADAMLAFGAQCIQDSRLAGEDTAEFRQTLNRVALNRDDKAHRFVVTWNAFLDGNNLAYLALAIAFAIDGLVFMSGLFGANVTKTPLSSSPGATGRTAEQLDQILEGALLPDIPGNAEVFLRNIHSIERGTDADRHGFAHEVDLANVPEGERFVVQTVLNAAGILGLVESPRRGHVLVRSQLYEAMLMLRRRHHRPAGRPSVQIPVREQQSNAMLADRLEPARIEKASPALQIEQQREPESHLQQRQPSHPQLPKGSLMLSLNETEAEYLKAIAQQLQMSERQANRVKELYRLGEDLVDAVDDIYEVDQEISKHGKQESIRHATKLTEATTQVLTAWANDQSKSYLSSELATGSIVDAFVLFRKLEVMRADFVRRIAELEATMGRNSEREGEQTVLERYRVAERQIGSFVDAKDAAPTVRQLEEAINRVTDALSTLRNTQMRA